MVTAKDADGCLRIGYFKLDRLESNESMKVFNLLTGFVPCGTKSESKDKRRFETMILNGELSVNKGIKQYSFKGTIGQINGIGEYQSISLGK